MKSRPETKDRPTGYDVWRWPEFRAFAERLGIGLDSPTRDLVISLPCWDMVTITETFLADDQSDLKPAETSTVQNEEWRTFQPPPK